MFQLCAAMRWNHLPVAGGIYDQDPELLDKFGYIFARIAEHDAEERKKDKREAERSRRSGTRRSSRIR